MESIEVTKLMELVHIDFLTIEANKGGKMLISWSLLTILQGMLW